MHAVFFEMRPHAGHLAHYFDHVARLKPVLARHAGLAYLDRYRSLADDDVLLSHQLWESEAAIAAWRADAEHRRSQAAGRAVHFANYRIRVGERVRHWQASTTESTHCAAATGDGQHVIALYSRHPIAGPSFTAFESVNHSSRFIALATTEGAQRADDVLAHQIGADGLEAAAVYAITRDYSQVDRAQAPNKDSPRG